MRRLWADRLPQGMGRGLIASTLVFVIASALLAFVGIAAFGSERTEAVRAWGLIASFLGALAGGAAGVWQAVAGEVLSRRDALVASAVPPVVLQLLFSPAAPPSASVWALLACTVAGALLGALVVARRISEVTVPD
jgi:hypothetical protein